MSIIYQKDFGNARGITAGRSFCQQLLAKQCVFTFDTSKKQRNENSLKKDFAELSSACFEKFTSFRNIFFILNVEIFNKDVLKMCYKPENDPFSEEGIKQAQPEYEQKLFFLSLDIDREKLKDCDPILENYGFSRDFKGNSLPESCYLGKVSEDKDTDKFLEQILNALKDEIPDKTISINICGGFVEKFAQKKGNDL